MCHVTKYCNVIGPHCTMWRDTVSVHSSPDSMSRSLAKKIVPKDYVQDVQNKQQAKIPIHPLSDNFPLYQVHYSWRRPLNLKFTI